MSAVSDQQWLQQIGVELDRPGDAAATSEAVDLDGGAQDGAPANERDSAMVVTGESAKARRYTPWVLGAFLAAAGLATAVTTLGVTLSGSDKPSPQHPRAAKSSAAVPTAAPAAPTPADTVDHPLPFTASADCPPGSTSAQSIADPDKPSPWICVRRTEGQPLYITLGPAIERSYVITAVSIVPGDTAAAQGSDKDPWLQHRVVARLQWQFNDTVHTVVEQDTGNVHGEVSQPVPAITASKITVIIRETSRPAAPTPTAAPGEDSGPLTGIFGGPPSSTSPDALAAGSVPGSDPSDGTFAVSSIKIIGHKAL